MQTLDPTPMPTKGRQTRRTFRIAMLGMAFALLLTLLTIGTGSAQTPPTMPMMPPPAPLPEAVPLPGSLSNSPFDTQPGDPGTPRASDKYKFDKNRLFLQAVTDFKEPEAPSLWANYLSAYCELIVHANRFKTDELLPHASAVPYNSLFQDERHSYRFDILKFEGKLIRLIKFPAPGGLASSGIDTLYEAWVFTGKTDKNPNPVCFILTELPEGLEPSLEYRPALNVRGAGYYFRTISYTSDEKTDKGAPKGRLAPLLMARSLVVLTAPTADNWANGFLPAVFAGILLITGLVLGMAWWFWASDRKTKAVIRKHITNPFPATVAPATEWGTQTEDTPPPQALPPLT